MPIVCLQDQAWVSWHTFHYLICLLFFLAAKEMRHTKLLSSCLLSLSLNNFWIYWPVWKWVGDGIRDNDFSTCFMKISSWIDERSKLMSLLRGRQGKNWAVVYSLAVAVWPGMPMVTRNCVVCFLLLGFIGQMTICWVYKQGDRKLSEHRA